jgi:hypothetical protein
MNPRITSDSGDGGERTCSRWSYAGLNSPEAPSDEAEAAVAAVAGAKCALNQANQLATSERDEAQSS